jgi:LysR family cys regulon transcriptional activator
MHMKLQQLRYLAEVARRDLSVSAAAEALFTSQPGVSKQIKSLEDELGVQIFARHGKRLTALTEPGRAVLAIAERILAEAANMKRAGEEFANEKLGSLTIAATHTQARYALPKAVAAFKRRYPDVQLVIHQGNPTQICEMVIRGEGSRWPPSRSRSTRNSCRCPATSGTAAWWCRRGMRSPG